MSIKYAERLDDAEDGSYMFACPHCTQHYSSDALPQNIVSCMNCFDVFAVDLQKKQNVPAPASPPVEVPSPKAVKIAKAVSAPAPAPVSPPVAVAAPKAVPVSPPVAVAAPKAVPVSAPAAAIPPVQGVNINVVVPPAQPPQNPSPAASGSSGTEKSANAAVGGIRIIGNILWLIPFGFIAGVGLLFQGALLCMTIIGIPFGLQIFKLANLVFCPFGADIYRKEGRQSVGCLASGMNVVWLLIGGLPMALCYFIFGLLLCITIIGIPFGLQYFKLGKLVVAPFGVEVRRTTPAHATYIAIAVICAILIIMAMA